MHEHPEHPIAKPVMFQGWEQLTFIHWPYKPETIRGLLPSSVELDTFEGTAWIGLTPFILTGLRFPFVPALPWISRFPEMNVRTYVKVAGERGIWFFSLEASRLAAVIGARFSFGLPYRWAAMRVRSKPDEIEYVSRRYVGHGKAHVIIRRGASIRPNTLERFLTARFRLYTFIAGRLAFCDVEHQPWPLQAAEALQLDQDVLQNSNVPAPSGKPLVHFSPGVYVRIGRPRLAR